MKNYNCAISCPSSAGKVQCVNLKGEETFTKLKCQMHHFMSLLSMLGPECKDLEKEETKQGINSLTIDALRSN